MLMSYWIECSRAPESSSWDICRFFFFWLRDTMLLNTVALRQLIICLCFQRDVGRLLSHKEQVGGPLFASSVALTTTRDVTFLSEALCYDVKLFIVCL